MKPIQKPKTAKLFPLKGGDNRVKLSVVSEKERQSARISTYSYILP